MSQVSHLEVGPLLHADREGYRTICTYEEGGDCRLVVKIVHNLHTQHNRINLLVSYHQLYRPQHHSSHLQRARLPNLQHSRPNDRVPP